MKRLFYILYAAFFNICRIFPLKENRVTFLSPHRENFTDSLGMVLREVEKRGKYDIAKVSSADLDLNGGIKGIFRAIGFFTVKAYLLATSKYVFLNDNFMPMGSLNFSKDAVITQLWHAEGVFKKFGLHIPQPEDVRKRELAGASKLSFVVCSSESVKSLYAEAFGVEENKVLPLGAPRCDRFFKECKTDDIKKKFLQKYPQCKGKKLVLYAPTFRDDAEEDKVLLKSIDMKKFSEKLSDEFAFLIRLHPQIHRCDSALQGAVDVTDWEDVGELTLICDCMITDYSSVCMDAALIGKPLAFYAFDLEKYASDRSFYFDYESYVPGPVAKSFDELLDVIKNIENLEGNEKLETFRRFNFGSPDGNSAKRVVDAIIK
ncbi:MAG: CDP-glycerol glycerophosphotransferase family protein [Clostridia bacterium]|nr:CDP-glycerol glycerophosphotransferase family protein [Clostridia bacterium]